MEYPRRYSLGHFLLVHKPHVRAAIHLVEGVGAGSPPGEEQRQADGLEDLGRRADGDRVDGPLLGE